MIHINFSEPGIRLEDIISDRVKNQKTSIDKSPIIITICE
jgi:hypothetical protein